MEAKQNINFDGQGQKRSKNLEPAQINKTVPELLDLLYITPF